MRIINSDGSEAEACGNGFRSIALYVKQQLRFRFPLKFESLAGLVEASFHGARVRVKLPDPKNFVAQETIHAKGHRLHYSFINTGVPHAVIFTEKLDGLDVAGIGAAIRYHRQFEPAGTNVNFVRVVSPSEIRVRTYERGVEAETLACGTGSTASALVSAYFRYAKPPVKVRTAGGEVLTVDFRWAGEKAEKVFLEGEARFVCEGKFYL
jgi:diaminopimelate epimerase